MDLRSDKKSTGLMTIFSELEIVKYVASKGSKKNKKQLDGFNPQWGGGFGPSPLFTYFLYF